MKKNFLHLVVFISFLFTTHLSSAQDAMIAEIRLFAGNFAPRGWAFCQGQILPIAQNTALFSILGTTYGGNGQTTFALPDLRGRVPVGPGQGPGLTNYTVGQQSGSETVTILINQLPAHNHTIENLSELGYRSSPPDKPYGKVLVNGVPGGSTPVTTVKTSITGGSQPVSIIQPILGLNYIICLQGIFPSRD